MAIKREKYITNLLKQYPDQGENLCQGYYIDENNNKVHISNGLRYTARQMAKHKHIYEDQTS